MFYIQDKNKNEIILSSDLINYLKTEKKDIYKNLLNQLYIIVLGKESNTLGFIDYKIGKVIMIKQIKKQKFKIEDTGFHSYDMIFFSCFYDKPYNLSKDINREEKERIKEKGKEENTNNVTNVSKTKEVSLF